MTRITRNTKRMFDFEGGEHGYGRITCDVEDVDGADRLFIDSIELNAKQCQKFIRWLEEAHRMILKRKR